MKKFLACLLVFCCLFPSFLSAEESWKDSIPGELKPWIPWVLKNETLDQCSQVSAATTSEICHWYLAANLQISGSTASFSLNVLLETKGRIILPYAENTWPTEVSIEQKSIPVLRNQKIPSVWLEPGSYTIEGTLNLAHEPPAILMPPSTGVIRVETGSQGIAPEVDSQGRVWLKKQKTEVDTTDQDFAAYQIFRKISDSLPAELETRLRINVGGRSRELALPDILLGTRPFELNGTLPARLDKDNRLFLRAAPGNWEVVIHSIIASPFSELTLNTPAQGMPTSEIWSFQSYPELRSVRLNGVDGVDPQQVNLPAEWISLPAFAVKAGETLKTSDEKRADVKSQENQLNIVRNIKLHSDGKAYSISDSISGTILSDGRLAVDGLLQPGSVNINGLDQAVTRLQEDGPAGVEVRTGPLSLTAESRLKRSSNPISINGWQATFLNPQIRLYLPPGWRLLHVSGADTVSGSWVVRWNLLDIFLILTASILMFKICGPVPGVVTGVALVLLEQEFNLAAIIVFLLMITALLKVITRGFFARLLNFTRMITMIGLVIAFMIFAIHRVKTALHPQLERPAFSSFQFNQPAPRAPLYSASEIASNMAEDMVEGFAGAPDSRQMKSSKRAYGAGRSREQAFQNYQNDTLNVVQTGFGKIALEGAYLPLGWRGPVSASEKVKFYYITPLFNFIIALIQVLLGALVIWYVALRKIPTGSISIDPRAPLVALSLFLLGGTEIAHAQQAPPPDSALLQELRSFVLQKLREKPECSPHCATIGAVQLQAQDRRFQISLQIHAEANTAVPLLANLNNIEIISVQNGAQQKLAVSKQNGMLLVKAPPGVSRVHVDASIRGNSASFSFIETPTSVTSESNGWTISGIVRGIGRDIKLEKIVALSNQVTDPEQIEGDADFGASAFLTPLVKIERALDFSANWTIHSTVSLANPAKSVQSFQLPLLDGEAVTSPGFEVENRKIKVTLQPGQQRLEWNSVLSVQDNLRLEADSANHISEVWKLNLSNLWHVDQEGTPRIQTPQSIGTNISEWHPRPGEYLLLKISRPDGIPGPTKTVQSANVVYRVGGKLAEASLGLTIKSSIGQPHQIALPTDAKIKDVKINGKSITSYSLNNQVLGFDLTPGEQKVEIRWMQPVSQYARYSPDPLDLGVPSVNLNTEIQLQDNRWILWTRGPTRGPAVLFWGLLPVILLVAVAIGKSNRTPLGVGGAVILMIGLSMQPLFDMIVIFGFFIILGLRGRTEIQQERRWLSNFKQICIGIAAAVAVSCLLSAIQGGLLGSPQMRIEGNGSYGHILKWYQDVSEGKMPFVQVISLNIFYYRLFMLLWALWLAFSIISWSIWSWRNFSYGGAWVERKPKLPKVANDQTS